MRIERRRKIKRERQNMLGRGEEEAGLEPDLQVHILIRELTQS
jgi:hypothetical protein